MTKLESVFIWLLIALSLSVGCQSRTAESIAVATIESPDPSLASTPLIDTSSGTEDDVGPPTLVADDHGSSEVERPDETPHEPEPIEPLCGFNIYPEYQNFALSSGKVHYVTGDNSVFRIDLRRVLVERGAYQPERLVFDDSFRFFYIASTAESDDLMAVWELDGEIYLIRPSENELAGLTKERYPNAVGLTVSPNSKWIGLSFAPDYSPPHYSERTEARLINSETGEQIVLADETAGYSTPIWSPAGDEVAYVRYDDDEGRIHVMNMRTREERVVSEPGECHSNIVWSRDGRAIAFHTAYATEEADTLYVIDVETGDRHELLRLDPTLVFVDNISGWSPSGRMIMLETYGETEQQRICLILADGKEAYCPFMSVEDWAFPFWLPGVDKIGLLQFESEYPRGVGELQFKGMVVVEPPAFGSAFRPRQTAF